MSHVCANFVFVSAVPRPRTTERYDVSWIADDPHVRFLSDGRYVLDNDLWLDEPAVQTLPRDVLNHLRRRPRRPVSPGVDDPQTEASWESIPTLVIIGSKDELIPIGDRGCILERFVDAQILPTDHFIIFRHPEVVGGAVLRALELRR